MADQSPGSIRDRMMEIALRQKKGDATLEDKLALYRVTLAISLAELLRIEHEYGDKIDGGMVRMDIVEMLKIMASLLEEDLPVDDNPLIPQVEDPDEIRGNSAGDSGGAGGESRPGEDSGGSSPSS